MGGTFQYPYSTGYTTSASFNDPDSVLYALQLYAGVAYTFSLCGDAWTDTFLRLYNSSDQQVAYNDDACGLQSEFTYTPDSTGSFDLVMGCYSQNTCSGTVTISPDPSPW